MIQETVELTRNQLSALFCTALTLALRKLATDEMPYPVIVAAFGDDFMQLKKDFEADMGAEDCDHEGLVTKLQLAGWMGQQLAEA